MDYECYFRTSEFRVTDEEAYKKLESRLGGAKIDKNVFEKNGETFHQLLGEGSPDFLMGDDKGICGDVGAFLDAISPLLVPGSSLVWFQIGHEGLRSVESFVAVAKNGSVKFEHACDTATRIENSLAKSPEPKPAISEGSVDYHINVDDYWIELRKADGANVWRVSNTYIYAEGAPTVQAAIANAKRRFVDLEGRLPGLKVVIENAVPSVKAYIGTRSAWGSGPHSFYLSRSGLKDIPNILLSVDPVSERMVTLKFETLSPDGFPALSGGIVLGDGNEESSVDKVVRSWWESIDLHCRNVNDILDRLQINAESFERNLKEVK